jgi:hypothetical protein
MFAEALSASNEPEGNELEALVAQIRASGRGITLPQPSSEAVQAFIEHVAAETPMSASEAAQWDRLWAGIVEEMRARDREDDRAEGRG